MARLTVGQKAERVLALMLGLRKQKIAETLAAHGFSDDDMAEGWQLMQGLTRTRLGIIAGIAAASPGLVQKVDAWENKWFPIAESALKRHQPALHAWMFRNLTQTEGAAALLSVGTFIERHDALTKPPSKGGPDDSTIGEAAKKLLTKRGITKEVIDEARALLEEAGTLEESVPQPAELDYTAAEAALWSWYLEWSTIARSAITSRKLLRELGFRQTTSKGEDADGEDEDDEASDPPGETAPKGG